MRLELITIGDELLLGLTIDTNAAYLARELAALGVSVVRRATVADDASEIASAVRDALERTGAVITTGGLGPTSDDLTRSAIADLFGRELEDGVVRERVRTRDDASTSTTTASPTPTIDDDRSGPGRDGSDDDSSGHGSDDDDDEDDDHSGSGRSGSDDDDDDSSGSGRDSCAGVARTLGAAFISFAITDDQAIAGSE